MRREYEAAEIILLAEDDESVRRLITRKLQGAGYTVLAAASGPEAIAISQAEQRQIALLLTDLVMPKMSGKQLSDILLASRPDMKVLYLSGHTETTLVQHGLDDGKMEFLAKPFRRDSLVTKIREILGPSQEARLE
jgi:two-component system cell cycle sensor histidine kinase/response regulator CckA